jgi:hypothetical protein
MEKEVLELGEIPSEESVEQEQDYKKLWEEEQARVDSISKNYKQEEASKNKLIHTLARLKGALEVNGIADIDDDFNITLRERKVVESPQISIDDQIKELKQKNRDGEIEFEDYSEKLADLVSEKKMQEYEKKVKNIQENDKVNADTKIVVENKQTEQAKVWDLLESTYPDHNIPNSRLQIEMSNVMTKNQHIYSGIDLKNPENIRWRLKLAEDAYNNLVNQGLVKAKETSNASRQNFGTIHGDKGTSSVDLGMNDKQKHVMSGFLDDPKLAKQINKMATTLNNNGALVLEG